MTFLIHNKNIYCNQFIYSMNIFHERNRVHAMEREEFMNHIRIKIGLTSTNTLHESLFQKSFDEIEKKNT